MCPRCGTVLVEAGRLGSHAPLAFAATAFVFGVPALLTPFVILGKFGNDHRVSVTDGFTGLWDRGFEPVASAVLIGGTLAPFALISLLIAILATDRLPAYRERNRRLRRWAERVEYWSMPEVQVLGVLVAFFKLGAVVDVTIGPGLICYGIASLFTLLAWRSFKLLPRQRKPRVTPAMAAAT